MASLPSGVVTLLFTDIEGSTRLWEDHHDLMRDALARHDDLMRTSVENADGFVFKTVGDAFCVAFATASQAVAGAIAAQSALTNESWPEPLRIRARMALHSGECVERERDYFGPTVNRAARLEASAHGGQIVLSATTRGLLGEALPDGLRLRDLGEHRLKDLGAPERVYQVELDTLPSEFPPLRSLENPALPNNLPRYASNFVGRDDELATVRALIGEARLVTLTGPGGAGKTRLATQAAADLLDGSGDGVWIVDLAPVTDEAMVPTAIADAIGLRTADAVDAIEGLVAALADRRLLIVLDNCEHLIDAVASAADRLLRSCAGIDLIATSREPLGITGEVVHRVPSLAVPDATETDANVIGRTESVVLFAERARLHDHAFKVDGSNATAVGAVCRRLDGIPLAVELAAARLRSLSVPEVLDRLDRRFRLLTGGSRTAMARQQTLRATIDWSFELLSPGEQAMLARTSVFSGGWDLSAATRVVAADTVEDDLDVFDAMTGLADKSLVNVTAGETTRYGLLETIREYAAEKLAANGDDANTALRASHLAYYLELAETAAPKLRTEEQKTWLDRLEADHDNFRAALVAASELTDEQSGLRLGIALRWYAWLRKRSADLVGPMADLVASSNGDPPLRADALVALAFILLDVYDFAGAAAAVDEAIQFFRSSSLDARLADALWVKSWIEIYGQDFTRVGALGQEGLVAAERAHDADTTARMHGVVALDAAIQGDLDAARTHFGLELQGYLDIGDRMAQGMCHNNFGESELVAGNLDPADTSLESAEAIARELHLPELLATVLLNRSNVADLRDDSACALARAAEALALVHRHNITRLSAGVLNASARALFGSSPLLSATVHGAIPNALAAGSMLGTLDARLHAENETRLRATLGTEELARCSATGHQLAMHDLLSLVREKSP